MLRISTLLALCALSATGYSQVTLQVSLDPTAPAGRVTADIYADVATTDAWLVGAIRVITANGAALHYGGTDDPNSPYPDFVIAPYGAGAVTDPHVTCVSRPRSQRNSANRFNDNADAFPAERYSPPGSLGEIVATSNELNLVWAGLPLPGPFTPSQDGYVARIVVGVSAPPGSVFGAGLIAAIPQSATLVLLSEGAPSHPNHWGMASGTYDSPGVSSGIDWAIWYEAPCIGDLDGSGEVNLNDLTTLLGHFGFPGTLVDGDIDGNGLVDLVDLTFLLGNFGSTCP